MLLIGEGYVQAGGVSVGLVELVPAVSGEKQVKAYDYVTVPFLATSHGVTVETFSPALDCPSQVTPISMLKPVVLSPGQPKKIALTFHVSGEVTDKQQLPVGLTLTAGDTGKAAGRASVILIVDHRISAEINDLVDSLEVTAGEKHTLSFTVANTGSSDEQFTVVLLPGQNVILRSSPRLKPLGPGAFASVKIQFVCSGYVEDYSSSLTVRILRNGVPLTSRKVTIAITRAAPRKRRVYYQFFTLQATLEHLRRSGQAPRTAMHLSVPVVETDDISFSSDVWMDNVDRDLITRRQKHSLSYGRSTVVYGNQPVRFSNLVKGTSSEYGLLFSKSFTGGKATLFHRDDLVKDSVVATWEKELTPKLAVVAGYMDSRSRSGDTPALTAANFKTTYLASKNVVLNAEIAESTSTHKSDIPVRTGFGYQLSGTLQEKKFQVRTLFRGGEKGFVVCGYTRGMELRASYDLKENTSIYSTYQQHLSYHVPHVNSGPTDYVPFRSENMSFGFRFPVSDLGLQGNLSFTTSSSDTGNPDDRFRPLCVRSNHYRLQLSRQFKAFTLGSSCEIGKRDLEDEYLDYQEYGLRGNYRHGRLQFEMNMNNVLNTTNMDTQFLNGRYYSSSMGYSFPALKTTIKLGWRREKITEYLGNRSMRIQKLFNIKSQLSSSDVLRFSYRTSTRGESDDTTMFLSFSHNFDLKIPFKRYGSVVGMTFKDINRNGIFDPEDEPLEGVFIRLDSDYQAVSNPDGRFEIYEVLPDTYHLHVDQTSYPIGLDLSDCVQRELHIGEGGNLIVNVPFQGLNRIQGSVLVEADVYLSRFTEISPERLRVVLKRGDHEVGETYTFQDGTYYFENIEPGQYEVTLDPEWLPAGAVIKGENSFPVNCDGLRDCNNIDFTIGPRQKKIIKTYQD